jgi:hypothetical protein
LLGLAKQLGLSWAHYEARYEAHFKARYEARYKALINNAVGNVGVPLVSLEKHFSLIIVWYTKIIGLKSTNIYIISKCFSQFSFFLR